MENKELIDEIVRASYYRKEIFPDEGRVVLQVTSLDIHLREEEMQIKNLKV